MNLTPAILFVLVLIAGCPIAAWAQSAGKVIERHVDAIGGKSAVDKILSTEMSGTITAADGRSGIFVQRTARPHLFSVSLSWGDLRWRTGFNGRSAWQDDGDGVRTLYGRAAARVRGDATYAITRLVVPEKVSRLSLSRRDQLGGREVIVMVGITPDGLMRTLFFDSRTYLLVKDEQQTDTGLEQRFFDDYRPVDHVMEPHRIEWHRNGEVFRIVIERVTHNAALRQEQFDVPVPPAEPPVDIEAVLSATGRSDEKAQSLRTSYAYTQALSVRVLDGQGRVTVREGSAFEIFHLGGQPVGRLVRKWGGQPLKDAERRSEDRRVSDLVQEYQRRGGSLPAGRLRREDIDVSAFLVRNLGGSLVLRVPVLTTGWFEAYRRVSQFTNGRRERIGQREAVVIDFHPGTSTAPGDIERQAGTMAGTMWIDEASGTVIRIESYFVDDYDSIVRGSSVWMEQTLVNDEIWLPSRIETNLRRSLNFGAFAQPLITVQFTDHKKFSVGTDSAVTLPDAGR